MLSPSPQPPPSDPAGFATAYLAEHEIACPRCGILPLMILQRHEIPDYGRPGARYINITLMVAGTLMAILVCVLTRHANRFYTWPRAVRWSLTAFALLAASLCFVGPAWILRK